MPERISGAAWSFVSCLCLQLGRFYIPGVCCRPQFANEDAQGASDRIDLEAAHGQSGIGGTFEQAGSLAALVARGTARALLGWLWRVVGLSHVSPFRCRGDIDVRQHEEVPPK